MTAATPKASQVSVEHITLEACRLRQQMGCPFVVSYGLGVDSTAMLIGLHREGFVPDAIIFADTGAEKRSTYAYLAAVNAWLRSVDFPEVTIVKYQPSAKRAIDPRSGEQYETFEGKLLATRQLPSLSYKGHSCSITWKQDAQHRYMKGWAPRTKGSTAMPQPGWKPALDAWARGDVVIKAIGYDCSAADMKRGNFAQKHEPKVYDYAYPLRWWGWTRDDCKRVIAEVGLPVPPKSSCTFCPAMKAFEVRELATDDPQALLDAIAIEDRAKAEGERIYAEAKAAGVDQRGKAFDEKKTESVRRGGLWTLMRPSKDCPTSWREFCEAEGLLQLAEVTLAKEAAEAA